MAPKFPRLVILISLLVEIIQYIFGLGVSDIDDVILNTFGGLVGILSYKVLTLIFKNDEKVRVIIVMLATIVAIPVVFLVISIAITR
ncbi:MAG: VanZ family protein [Syntrophomonadaceae bacterium]|nr:VanZ family protein [Syntrophomonadaceae bacterium]